MPQETSASVFPSDADIHAMLVDRIDVRGEGVGVVVGVVDAQGRRVVAHGELRKGGGVSVDGGSVFEIGSIGKVLTTLLLAEMAERGEVRLDDPISAYLPAGIGSPTYDGRPITLIDLATHTSGLPRMDPAHRTSDPEHPFALAGQAQALADYSTEDLYAFLGTVQLTRPVGSRCEYSNLGLGLLGHVLALRGGGDFGALMAERVTAPLGMADTVLAPNERLRARLATAHDHRRQPVANMQLRVLAGAGGALRSTADDLLKFLAAELGYRETPLSATMAAQRAPRRPTRLRRMDVALGWHVSRRPGREIFWHSGATVGSASFLGFDAALGAGVVVLTNFRGAVGDSIGLRLLNGAAPTTTTTDAVALPAGLLDRYVGRYQRTPRSFISVSRDGSRLLAQRVDRDRSLPIREIYPQSATYFCWKDADAEATFEVDSGGQPTALVLHLFGAPDSRWLRVASA